MNAVTASEAAALAGERARATGALLDEVSRPQPLSLVVLVVLAGTSTSIAFHYVMGAYLHFKYPYSSFLFLPKDRFMDFFNVYDDAVRFHPGASSNMVYSPLLHAFMTVTTAVPAWLAFAVVLAAFLATLAALLWKWTTAGLRVDPMVRVLHVAVLTFLAYPVLFVVDRGNLEMVVFVMLAAFFYLYYVRHSPWAWLPLSLAIASKYYWITLVILLLLDRRVRQAILAVGGAVVVSAVAVLFLAGASGYSLTAVLASLRTTLDGHMGATGVLGIASHSHSLWAWVICIIRWSDYAFYWLPVNRIYTLSALLILLLVVRRLWRGRFADWQKATAIVACTLVLPFESMDYTLIHLYFPLTLFAIAAGRFRLKWVVAVLFALLLIPLDYYYFTFVFWRSLVSTSSLIYPMCLLGLIVAALWCGDPGEDSAELTVGSALAPAGERP